MSVMSVRTAPEELDWVIWLQYEQEAGQPSTLEDRPASPA
jgi:hypothetical protein